MVRDITLGQYFPGKSFVHRLDPRIKIILTFVYIVFIFIANNFPGLLIVVGLVLGTMLLSGVPVSQYMRSLKGVLFVILFTSLLNLFYGGGPVVFRLGFITITQGGIINFIFIGIRIVSLILFSSVLTFTTSPTELTDALERIMKPLKVFRVIPVHEIAMMMTIALRFVPTLLEETDKIMSAQKARGADMESGGLMQRIRALIPVLIPLFVSSFRRAYDLAMAMECRCYHGGEGRTKMKSLHMTGLDTVAISITIVICTGVVLCAVFLPTAFV
jgi:energy-coupling factor transport system permease protein